MTAKKGLGRGLSAIVPLAPALNGAAQIDDAIHHSTGPSVLALSGQSMDEIARVSALSPPRPTPHLATRPSQMAQHVSQPVVHVPVAHVPVAHVPVAHVPAAVVPAAAAAAAPAAVAVLDLPPALGRENRLPPVAAFIDDEIVDFEPSMADARRPTQYSLFDTPKPESKPECKPPAPVAAAATPPVVPSAVAPLAVPAPSAAAPSVRAVDPIVVATVVPVPEPEPEQAALCFDDQFVDEQIGGIVLPDVELE